MQCGESSCGWGADGVKAAAGLARNAANQDVIELSLSEESARSGDFARPYDA